MNTIDRRTFSSLIGLGVVAAVARPVAKTIATKPESFPSVSMFQGGAGNPMLDHVIAEYEHVWAGLVTLPSGSDATAVLATFAAAQRLEQRAMRDARVQDGFRLGVKKAINARGKSNVAVDMYKEALRSEAKFDKLYAKAGKTRRPRKRATIQDIEAALDSVVTTDIYGLLERSMAFVGAEIARLSSQKGNIARVQLSSACEQMQNTISGLQFLVWGMGVAIFLGQVELIPWALSLELHIQILQDVYDRSPSCNGYI